LLDFGLELQPMEGPLLEPGPQSRFPALGPALSDLTDARGDHQDKADQPADEAPAATRRSDESSMREPDQGPGDRPSGVLEVADLRDEQAHQGDEPEEAEHLGAKVVARAGLRSPADDRHEGDQAADDPRSTAARLIHRMRKEWNI